MLFDLKNPIPIYSEIDFDFDRDNKRVPFGLSQAKRGNFPQSLRCEIIEFIPHVHTTHLETSDHINTSSVIGCLPMSFSEPLYTQIIDIESEFKIKEGVEFVIIKKLNPKMNEFSGVDVNVIEKIILKSSVKVIGINEPSFDPEFDNGALLAHKTAFKKEGICLVEMLNLSSLAVELNEFYYCLMNIFRFSNADAYPCSPILYPMKYKMTLCDSCIFCKIIRGIIPSFKVYETKLTFAFLDINPLSEGHIVR